MSMFSQSFCLSEETMAKLQNLAKTEKESLEIIEESPTNKSTTYSLRERFKSIKTQNTSKLKINQRSLKRNKSDPIKQIQPSKQSTETFSQFFLDELKENSVQREQENGICSNLAGYFKDSDVDFFNLADPQIIQLPKVVFEKSVENAPASLFDDSAFDVGTQNCLNQAITIDNVPESQEEPRAIEAIDQNEIIWEHSDDDEFGQLRFTEDKYHEKSDLIILQQNDGEELCHDHDNITFTQDCLKIISQKEITSRQFVHDEIRNCRDMVKSIIQIEDDDIDLHVTSSTVSCKPEQMLKNSSQNLKEMQTLKKGSLNIHSQNVTKIVGAKNKIENWGLPSIIVQEYMKKGIKSMFDWQVECLSNNKVLFESANLVYSAPTSAGKTLVSEILMIKNVLERHKKALFILPFISVVREKMMYLQDLLLPGGIQVEGYFGGYTAPYAFESVHIAVCTIEKANSIVNKLLEQQKIESIGCIVVDEIHLISDSGRGYILELLLSKILYISKTFGHQIQIITMSATLPNVNLLAAWLKAEFYSTQFRPVELREMIKVENKIYDSKMTFVRDLLDSATFGKDQDGVAQLCIETILERCSVIVFCPSKDWCESLSKHIASVIYSIGKTKTDLGAKLRSELDMERIEEIKAQFRNCSTGLDKVLEQTISYACAFHHAGLTFDERDIIESSFKQGALRVIVATSTLSSGVNLPARRVIIRTPLFGGKPMNPLTYKQMIGRAGRTGKDTLGESYLICGAAGNAIKAGKELLSIKLKPITSCLDVDNCVHLKRAILEIIAAGVANTKNDLECFTNSTLLAMEKSFSFDYFHKKSSMTINGKSKKSKLKKLDLTIQDSQEEMNDDEVAAAQVQDPIANCMQFLINYEFIRQQMNEDTNEMNYIATRLGNACLASSMPPSDGFLLFSELQKSRQCFVLESELHAVYLVTPFSVCFQMENIDWLAFLDMWEKLPTAMRRVGEIVGVKESFLVKAMRNHKLDYKQLQIHKRFYIALALQELVNEKCINEVSSKYKCTRGLLQSLQQMASTFAGVVTAFCQALNWNMLALIISQFKERLFFGVHRDLIDLMKCSNLSGPRARALFDAGYKSLAELANADVFSIEKVLYNCICFDSKQREGETDLDADKRNKIRFLFVTGKPGLTVREAAKLIIDDARRYLEAELGVQNVHWTRNDVEKFPSQSITSSVQKNLCAPSDKNKVPHTSGDVLLEKSDTNICKQNGTKNPSPIASEDIFGTDSTSSNRKRKSPDKCPTTRKSPRIHNNLQTIGKKKETARKSNGSLTDDDVIQQTPIVMVKSFKKTQSRTQSARKMIKDTTAPQADVDSIEFSLNSTNIDANSSHILNSNKIETKSENLSKLHIIRVFDSSVFFGKFKAELNKCTNIGLAVACNHNLKLTKPKIGANLMSADGASEELKQFNCIFDGCFYIDGISLYLEADTSDQLSSYYFNLQDAAAEDFSFDEKCKFFEELFTKSNISIKVFDAKAQLKILLKAMPKVKKIKCQIEDPKIANWLLQPEVEGDLLDMAAKYAPECVSLVELAGAKRNDSSSISLKCSSSVSPKIRGSVESCVTMHVLNGQKYNLRRIGNGEILKAFTEMEMPIQKSLMFMELIGLNCKQSELAQTSTQIAELMRKLEKSIYQVNGRKFNLNSASEVAKVLGLLTNKSKPYSKVSTTKQVLENMLEHPLSNLIVQHRKLSAILSKTIRPLLLNIVDNKLYGNSISFTSTGRISMQEPNLQNVAKDFTLVFDNAHHTISCRSAFKAPTGRILISADFCQLELRVLTHLSKDPILLHVMSSTKDVFRSIAARWNKLYDESAVTEKQRNDTKQICYGIIYGMGIKSLAEQLRCDEESAESLLESFHKTYPGISLFTENIIKFARETGYVETFSGRRRYLPNLSSDNAAHRAQAERQAINTTIQGSAADIAKYAILRMNRNLEKYKDSLKINQRNNEKSCVHLVLHLHDELFYEVPKEKCKAIIKILKSSMENCASLKIPLLVKIKSGNSWGTLREDD